jgi:predicted small metal-binding protein
VRAVDCWCGYLVQGENDGELERGLREHLDEEHGNEQRSAEDVRSRVSQHSYEPPTGDPPWAY